MIIAEFHVEGITIDESKADAPLVIDGDGMLALTIILECMEAISRRYAQVVQARREIDILEFARCPLGDLWLARLRSSSGEQLPSAAVRERLDH